jgi:hypothetical protein
MVLASLVWLPMACCQNGSIFHTQTCEQLKKHSRCGVYSSSQTHISKTQKKNDITPSLCIDHKLEGIGTIEMMWVLSNLWVAQLLGYATIIQDDVDF